MGRFDLRPGEEPFFPDTEPSGPMPPSQKVTNPDQFINTFHKTSVQPNGDPFPPAVPLEVNRERFANQSEATEDAAAHRQHLAEMRRQGKAEAVAYRARRSGKPVERQPGDGLDDAVGAGEDAHAFERRAAFAYGLGNIAHQLGSIAGHQGDLHSASRRFL